MSDKTAPRYETAYELGQRIGHTDSVVCAGCGVFVMDVTAHTRFHSILSSEPAPPSDEDHRGRIVIACTQHGVANCWCLTAPRR